MTTPPDTTRFGTWLTLILGLTAFTAVDALIECIRMSAPLRERRLRIERRRSVFHALWRGNFERRRVAPRRNAERHAVVTDWFHPQWLAVAMLIMLLCSADALLTLTLISHGADEINPFMAPQCECPMITM